jgi:signal transduction histidine kinase
MGALKVRFAERLHDTEAQLIERNNYEERLRELTTRLLQAQDDEARRIARELHDSAGQYIAAIQMNLGAVTRDASSPLTTSQAKRICDSVKMLSLCSDEIRTISYLLHPPLLDEMGLASALSWYSDGFTERSGILVELDISKGFGRLSTETETAMFRIVQQSLANIYRHSGSHVARIKIRRNAKEITMMICDEGCGIAADVLKEFYLGTRLVGVGIAGMRERTQVMKGRFRISSASGGTTIEISLPLAENTTHR